jgi:hypothetical protein
MTLIYIVLFYFVGVIITFFSFYIINRTIAVKDDFYYTSIKEALEIMLYSWAILLFMLIYMPYTLKKRKLLNLSFSKLPLPKKLQSIKNYINKFIINF